jgi:hypothetical protein
MLWVLLRRVGAQVFPACFAVGFFALHAALFDVVCKPAFVFDLLCATLCLASAPYSGFAQDGSLALSYSGWLIRSKSWP